MRVDYKQPNYPNRLRVIRQHLGYDQKQVALWLGHKTAAPLCEWERAVTMPNGTNLIKLAVLYGKTVQELYPQYYGLIERHTLVPASDLSRRRWDARPTKK
jgi:transcriptional regulator with XRE-family HTH domain